jgi:DNA gyrase subunit A
LRNGKEAIVVTEIPFQVNKGNLLEKIAELVRDKRIDGISDLRDESDRDGMRIVIELKRDTIMDVVLNQLYAHTTMQSTFSITMLGLDHGVPRQMTLKELIEAFVEHRHQVVVNRTKYDLRVAEERAHILEGYRIALDNIDAVIDLIRKSKDTPTAREGLMKKFKLSEIQATAILEMRLQRLTGLERQKIEDEYLTLIKRIAELKAILESKALRMQIIIEKQDSVSTHTADRKQTPPKLRRDLIRRELVTPTRTSGITSPVISPVASNSARRGFRMDTKERIRRTHFHRLDPRLHFVLFQPGSLLLGQGSRDSDRRQADQGQTDRQHVRAR